MAVMAAILKIYFELLLLNLPIDWKLDRNWVTCRSKTAIFFLTANPIWPPQSPSWNSILNFFVTKTRLYNFDPLKPHFYIVKLGFTGVYIFLLYKMAAAFAILKSCFALRMLNFSWTKRPVDSKVCRKYQGDLQIKTVESIPIRNPRWPPLFCAFFLEAKLVW